MVLQRFTSTCPKLRVRVAIDAWSNLLRPGAGEIDLAVASTGEIPMWRSQRTPSRRPASEGREEVGR